MDNPRLWQCLELRLKRAESALRAKLWLILDFSFSFNFSPVPLANTSRTFFIRLCKKNGSLKTQKAGFSCVDNKIRLLHNRVPSQNETLEAQLKPKSQHPNRPSKAHFVPETFNVRKARVETAGDDESGPEDVRMIWILSAFLRFVKCGA